MWLAAGCRWRGRTVVASAMRASGLPREFQVRALAWLRAGRGGLFLLALVIGAGTGCR